jgi:hypothetical protein
LVWVLALACCCQTAVGAVLAKSAHAGQVPETVQKTHPGDTDEISGPQSGAPSTAPGALSRDPQPAYADNGNGTVTDRNSGLIWQRGDEQNDSGRTWREALDYCAGLDLASHHDWRLPTVEELRTIVDPGRSDPTIDIRYFPDCQAYNYWSGNTRATNPDEAWVVNFYFGHAHHYPKDVVYCYVRCVLDGP